MEQHTNQLNQLVEHVGDIRESLARNTAILDVNTESLKEHMAQTRTLREYVDKRFSEVDSNLDVALQPIKAFKFMAKVSAGVSAMGGALYAVYKFFTH